MLKKNKYRLIAFDIDGTILDGNHQVCSELVKVVKILKQKGYLFTLVSARTPLSVINIASTLGIGEEPIIALNGGFIADSNHNILYNKRFVTNKVMNHLSKLDKEVSRNYYDKFDWFIEYPNLLSYKEVSILANVVNPTESRPPKEVNKITLIGENSLLATAQELLIKDENLLVSFSHTNYLEITCSSITKFNGLEYYASTLNIPVDEIIAFGDGENDIPMLSKVGLGVAMANAKDHVKASASDVAGFHYEQGVANYLSKLLL